MKKLWPIYSIISAIFISISAILSKNINNVDILLQTAIFTSIMSITLLIVVIFSGKIKLIKTINMNTILHILPTGILAGLGWLAYLFSLKCAPTCHLSTVAAIEKSSIGFIAILAIIFLKDKVNVYSILGVIFFISGILLMLIK